MKMEFTALDNYIVRIYRRDGDDPRKVAGIVEEFGVKGNHVFHNLDELWDILASQKIHLQRKKKKEEKR